MAHRAGSQVRMSIKTRRLILFLQIRTQMSQGMIRDISAVFSVCDVISVPSVTKRDILMSEGDFD